MPINLENILNTIPLTAEKLVAILNLARLAPSVHNTQPWKVKADGNTIIIKLDPKFTLLFGDPTGRETIISLGIFTEAFRVSAESLGFEITSLKLHDKSVEMKLTSHPVNNKSESVSLLKKRCTDRSIYIPAKITSAMKGEIVGSSPSHNAHVHMLSDKISIDKIAELTSKGIRVAMSNPRFRKELSHYLLLPWSKKQRGIAVESLQIPWIIAICQPIFVRLGLELDAEAKLEKRRWKSASGVVAITTSGDMNDDWFEAGRAYLSVSLTIEKLGLAQATSAATVEASNYHEDIEEMLETSERLQCMIRIGKSNRRKEFSPRVNAETLLAT